MIFALRSLSSFCEEFETSCSHLIDDDQTSLLAFQITEGSVRMAEALAETIPCDICHTQVTLDDWISHSVSKSRIFRHRAITALCRIVGQL